MDFRLEIVDVELVRSRSYIALCIPISASHSIKVSNEHIMSDIEFTVVVKKWPIDVHLHNISSFSVIFVLFILNAAFPI